MQLHCRALSLQPRWSNWPALVAAANANALQLPLPPNPGWPVSPVFWVLYHGVGYLRQPWDPRNRARQGPPVGERCPVNPVDGMKSGYDYDYDYVCTYVCMYVCMYVFPLTKLSSGMYSAKEPQYWTAETDESGEEGIRVPEGCHRGSRHHVGQRGDPCWQPVGDVEVWQRRVVALQRALPSLLCSLPSLHRCFTTSQERGFNRSEFNRGPPDVDMDATGPAIRGGPFSWSREHIPLRPLPPALDTFPGATSP